MKPLLIRAGLITLLVGGLAQAAGPLARPQSGIEDAESVSCAVGKAVRAAWELGETKEVFAVALELSPDGRTITVEIGAIEERGGGLVVEVDVRKCEVMEISHSQ